MGGEYYISESVKYDSSLKLGRYSCIEGLVEIGKNVKIGNQVTIEGLVEIGKNVKIGNNVTISSEKSRIKIGDGVEISAGCTIMPDDFEDDGNLEIVVGEGSKLKRNASLEGDVVLGAGCKLGIGTIIGKHCKLGEECDFRQYVSIAKNTTMGKKNVVYPFTDIGSAPQGKHYEDEGTSVEIGDENLIREGAVINRGSKLMGEKAGVTKIGNRNKIFSQTHIAHDCQIGDDNEIISFTGLAGHVVVGNYVKISGEVGIGQFAHIGSYSMIAGGAKVMANVLPYSVVGGMPAEFRIINFGRLKIIHGDQAKPYIKALRGVYEIVNNPKIKKDSELLQKLRELDTEHPYAKEIADFIEAVYRRADAVPVKQPADRDKMKHLLRFPKQKSGPE